MRYLKLNHDKGRTPEVVLGIAGENMVICDANTSPNISGLGVRLQALFGIAFEIGNIETILGQFIDLCQELPCPGNGFFLT